MIRHHSILRVALLFCATQIVTAQTPAPPVPALTKEQKEAAAAIEAPKTFAPPPAPGQLQNGKPAAVPVKAPEAAVPAASPPAAPPPPAANSANKLKVLDAVTQKPAATVAPHVSTTADKLPITSSTSTSRQFIVHGKVFETRSAMSSRCEEIAQELRKVLNDKEPWVIPIVVLLNTGEEAAKSKGPPISTTISELTHGGFHLQVTLNERPGLTQADLRKEVVRALLAERILRNHKQITTPEGRLLLPDWIMTGVLLAMDYKADARPSVMFASIFRSGKIYGIEEIIAASPVAMDGLSRTIYETSCCALMLALIDQPNGPQHLNKFLNSLASDPRSERQLLDAAFPNFAASASSLNKWWSLQLAALSRPGIAEPLTAAESLKAIEEAIAIRYEARADEVPKNVKLRPFVIPAPLVVASNEPKPLPQADTNEPKSRGNNAKAGEEAQEKPKRSLWRRLLFLGDPAEETPKTKVEDKPVETAAEKKPAAADEEKPGFFARLFTFGGDEKKPVEKEKAAKVEKTKPASKDKPVDEKEDDKPSILNPFNWFRGDKKTEEDNKNDKPAKKDQSSADAPDSTFDVARLLSPALADAWQFLSPPEPRLTAATAPPIFDFRKRKTQPEEGKQKAESKKEEPPKKSAAKPDAKKDSKPHTTNPNAKPAGKTTPAAPGAPKTINPNARPVPAGLVKPATSAAKTALVPVVLPLEEYQHILKHPDRVKILSHNAASLRALELRVSVLFRPVVSAYLAAVLDLQAGKTQDMDKRLATLHEFALVAYQKSVAVRDYLDWFEASESGRLSGKFDGFLNLPTTIQKELPARTDPISKYLDAIDKEFSK